MGLNRRRFFELIATASVVSVAGCSSSGDSNSGEDGNSDDNGGADGGEDDGDSNTDGNADDGASFDLDIAADQIPDAFESLVVEFTGFEFFSMTGSTVAFESDPVQVDLTELASSGGSTDLMETTVPADEYDNITYFITVTDTTMSSDGGEQTFRSEEDGEVLSGLADPGSDEGLGIESGESVTLTAEMSVQDAFDYDWKFEAGFSVDREA